MSLQLQMFEQVQGHLIYFSRLEQKARHITGEIKENQALWFLLCLLEDQAAGEDWSSLS